MARRRDKRTEHRREHSQGHRATTGIAFRMGDPKVWALLTALLVIGIAAYLLTDTPQAASSPNEGSLAVLPEVQSLGEVSVASGDVSTAFRVTNRGDQPITIEDMETSCMCTEATLISQGVAGPAFGMRGHGTGPTGWSATVGAAETATLRVDYDPTVHPDLRGSVTRVVRLYTDSPDQPFLDAAIELVQTD